LNIQQNPHYNDEIQDLIYFVNFKFKYEILMINAHGLYSIQAAERYNWGQNPGLLTY
jgi:hypothetical protein